MPVALLGLSKRQQKISQLLLPQPYPFCCSPQVRLFGIWQAGLSGPPLAYSRLMPDHGKPAWAR
ncbi:hypothetical protein D3C71_2190290 [compost metagenome]